MLKTDNKKFFTDKGKLKPKVFLKFESNLGYKDEWLEFVDSVLSQKQMNDEKETITKFSENKDLK